MRQRIMQLSLACLSVSIFSIACTMKDNYKVVAETKNTSLKFEMTITGNSGRICTSPIPGYPSGLNEAITIIPGPGIEADKKKVTVKLASGKTLRFATTKFSWIVAPEDLKDPWPQIWNVRR